MASPSLTYTLTNGQTADASQVMQNFNDLLNGITDGTKDLSISALTCAGTATLNGNINLGNASSDDLTVTASLASDLVPKTPSGTYNLGSAALGFLSLYLAASGDGDTARIVAASHGADRTYTIPDCSAAASFVMTESAQTVNGVLTMANGIKVDDAAGQTALNFYQEDDSTLASVTFTPNGSGSTGVSGVALKVTRIGRAVTVYFPRMNTATPQNSSTHTDCNTALPTWARPSAVVALYATSYTNGSTWGAGVVEVSTAGILSFYRDAASTAYSNGSACGFERGSITFHV